MKDFFISYTQADEDWATWIASILEAAEYTVFIQAWDILPGDNFIAEMQKAMTQTHRTIAVLSDAYFQSKYAEDEWTAAIARETNGSERRLIPIRVKPCDPKGFFATRVYLDIVGQTEIDARKMILGGFGSRRNSEQSNPVEKPTDSRLPTHPRALFPGPTFAVMRNLNPATPTINFENAAPLPKFELNSAERASLIKNLNRLSLDQFNVLIFTIDPPPNVVPGLPAAQDERVAALISWAETRPGGLHQVQTLFGEILKNATPLSTNFKSADRGSQIVTTFDRHKQEEHFNSLFNLIKEQRRGKAQFYVIHGNDLEGHSSLVQRFCATTLRAHLGGRMPEPWDLSWPQTGKLKVDSARLVSLLFEHSGHEDRPGSLSKRAEAFRAHATSLPKLVVIHHCISSGDWRWSTRKLIQSYLKFWDEVTDTNEPAAPLFLIFFSIHYTHRSFDTGQQLRRLPRAFRQAAKTRIKLELWLLRRTRGRSPFLSPPAEMTTFTTLRELACVGINDLRDWLRKHHFGEFDGEFVRQSQHIFIKQNWELFECQSMANMEGALLDFLDDVT